MRRTLNLACPAVAFAVAIAALVAVPAMAAPHSPAETQLAGTQAASAAPGSVSAAPAGAAAEVTLVTGDRIRVVSGPAGTLSAAVERQYARPGIAYYERTIPGPDKRPDLLVIPSDAAGLVASGGLDENLFDVSELVRDGYEDSATQRLPLIVSYRGSATAGELPRASGETVTGALPSIKATTVTEAKSSARSFWAQVTRRSTTRALTFVPQIAKVWLDGKVQAAVGEGTAAAGTARAATDAAGTARDTTKVVRGDTATNTYDGTGVLVADLDTGYDPTNPALSGVVEAAQDFTGSANGTTDVNGHGTWTASIIAGNGADSGGEYEGVAPGARLLIGKVLGDSGTGTDSQTIAGMQWAVTQHAKIVNMSLGEGRPWICEDGTDPVSQALDSLSSASGTLFVVAAGNDGQGSVEAPGTADAALTVGAVDSAGEIASFSSAGPRCGDFAIKPDITAPGVGIVGARAAGTSVGAEDGFPGDGPVSTYYTRASGTSASAPYVSGSAAELAQEHPGWSDAQLKAALMGAATPDVGTSVDAQGDGQASLARALSQDAYAIPGSVSELLRWPHTSRSVMTVTYHNPGTAALTLSLTLADTGPGITLSTHRITVAPGGTVPVRILVHEPASGRYAGWLTAADQGVELHTAVAVQAQPRLGTITFTGLDRTGTDVNGQVDDYGVPYQVVSLSTGEQEPVLASPSGAITAEVPPGRYDISAVIYTPSTGSVTLQDDPVVAVTRDMTVAFDARKGIPTSATVDSPVGDAWEFAGVTETIAGQAVTYGASTPPGSPLYAVPTARVTGRPYEFLFTDYASGATAAYSLEFPTLGRIPARLAYQVHDQALAEVRETFRQQGVPMTFVDDQHYAVGPEEAPFGFGAASEFYVPPTGTVTEYFSPGQWYTLDYYVDDNSAEWAEQSPVTSYRGGTVYDEAWGSAAVSTASMTTRLGNEITPEIFPGSTSAPGHVAADVDPSTLTGSITLRRGSEPVGTTPVASPQPWTVPVGTYRYTLSMSAQQSVPWSVLGTSERASWSFRSGQVSGSSPLALPLWDVRIGGAFDSLDQAPPGSPFQVTIAPDLPAGAPRARVTSLTVRASFDDGKTWQRLVLHADGADRWTATVTPPAGTAFVSLSTALTDSAGNTATQTVIRAYQV